MQSLTRLKIVFVLIFGILTPLAMSYGAEQRISLDCSKVRGFNYQSAESKRAGAFFLQYDPAVIEFDLDLAKRLNLNQARVFFGYVAYTGDRETYCKNMLHLVRACHQRGMGLMPVVCYRGEFFVDPSTWPEADEYAAFLVKILAGEPGLAIWDVANEPDNKDAGMGASAAQKYVFLRHIAGVFRRLDPKTPVTIGFASEPPMEVLADAVDILSYHDYKLTRAQIQANITRAKSFAAKAGKPLLCSEIGCIGRANPYDVALEEYNKAGIGWYIWELMITKRWGTVHGIFYADGTVRDPSIVAALMGCYRNRGPNVVAAVPDEEGYCTRTANNIRKWLSQTDSDWEKGLDLAETAANLLEAGELVPLYELPTRQVNLLRQQESPDIAALRELLGKFATVLEQYKMPPKSNRPLPGNAPRVIQK